MFLQHLKYSKGSLFKKVDLGKKIKVQTVTIERNKQYFAKFTKQKTLYSTKSSILKKIEINKVKTNISRLLST